MCPAARTAGSFPLPEVDASKQPEISREATEGSGDQPSRNLTVEHRGPVAWVAERWTNTGPCTEVIGLANAISSVVDNKEIRVDAGGRKTELIQ